MEKLFEAISKGDVDRCRRTIAKMGHPNLDAVKNAQGDTLLTRAALHQAGPTALALANCSLSMGLRRERL